MLSKNINTLRKYTVFAISERLRLWVSAATSFCCLFRPAAMLLADFLCFVFILWYQASQGDMSQAIALLTAQVPEEEASNGEGGAWAAETSMCAGKD